VILDFVLTILNFNILSINGVFSKNVTHKKYIIFWRQFNSQIFKSVVS